MGFFFKEIEEVNAMESQINIDNLSILGVQNIPNIPVLILN
jgi:hypothetical protein